MLNSSDGPVACLHTYALVESGHRSTHLSPRFQWLHNKKRWGEKEWASQKDNYACIGVKRNGWNDTLVSEHRWYGTRQIYPWKTLSWLCSMAFYVDIKSRNEAQSMEWQCLSSGSFIHENAMGVYIQAKEAEDKQREIVPNLYILPSQGKAAGKMKLC